MQESAILTFQSTKSTFGVLPPNGFLSVSYPNIEWYFSQLFTGLLPPPKGNEFFLYHKRKDFIYEVDCSTDSIF